MLEEQLLTPDALSKEKLQTLTKEELIERIDCINSLRIELFENLAESHEANEKLYDTNKRLSKENKELKRNCDILWKLLSKCVDFKDMLDDLEDTAEEIRAAAEKLKSDDGD